MEKKSLTLFEWKILAQTMKIPLGQTRSYRWVAQTIGRPKAVRAVGQALKKNPFPLIIPCHRVIKENGQSGGYSGVGGPKAKQSLILLEKTIARHLKIARKKKHLK